MLKKSPPIFGRLIPDPHSTSNIFDTLIRFVACALAAQTCKAECLEEVKQWKKHDMELFMEAFSALINEMALPRKEQQEQEVPPSNTIRDLITKVTLGTVESLPEEGGITICEPACDAGVIILSLSQICPSEVRRRPRVITTDVSSTACDMAFINTTFWGISTRVIHGNSLSMEWWAAWSSVHYIAAWLPTTSATRLPKKQNRGITRPVAVEHIKAPIN